jgi:alcohol dehydrogenase class IV
MHALAHPIGALFDTHHGMTNAVLMPYVLAFNREAIAEKAQRLAAWLGLASGGSSDSTGFDAFQRFVLDLRARIGVPHTLAELGVTDEERIALLADMAAVDPSTAGNPRSFDRAAAAEVLDSALKGKL